MGDFYEIMARFTSSIAQFRIIQESYEQLKILIVLSPLRDSKHETQISIKQSLIESLKKELRPEIEYEVEFVDRMPPDETGKIRIIISKVEQGE